MKSVERWQSVTRLISAPSLVDRLNATLSAMMGHFQRLKTLISAIFGGNNKRDNDSDYGMGPNVVRDWASIYKSAG